MNGDGAVVIVPANPDHVVRCSVCGESLTVDDATYKEAMKVGGAFAHGHHTDETAAPVLRKFEARVLVVEVRPDGTEETLLGATARAEAFTVKEATDDQLSTALQKVWLDTICANAHLADA